MARATPGNIGPYRLLNVIHTGQTCQLWQAYDDGKKRMVGIKTLQEKFWKDSEQIAHLRHEYEIGRKVVHKDIIAVYGFDIERGAPYLAMEWFAAPNLKQRIQQGVDRIAYLVPNVIQRAAEALAHLHQCGWVHRDIKPDNFLLADDGRMKMIDLGLATRARHGLAKLLHFQSKVQGTPSYMSPEQIRKKALDERADVYSFGCMIHELVSGKAPFTAMNLNDLLNKHLKSPPPSLEGLNPNVTRDFAELVKRMLAKDATKRTASMGGFLSEFRGCRVYTITPRPPDPNTP